MLNFKYAHRREPFLSEVEAATTNKLRSPRFLLFVFVSFWLNGGNVGGCLALNPIEIRGYKFFDSVTGQEFRIRGIDYYPRPNTGNLNQNSIDYFTEEHRHVWERDLPYLQELGVNAIRIYAINAKYNHDAFMCALERAGMYVIVELAHDCPTCAVTKDAAPMCYLPQLKGQGQDVIRHMSTYSNVLGFSAGNEVNHYAPPGFPQHNAPCQKKFLRDMRHYVESCAALSHMRKVPIGLVAADSDRVANAMYYNCQSNPNDPFEAAEWYGLNSYVNCDGRAQRYADALGFNTLQQNFASYNYSIPVILTEFGCLSDTFPTVDGYEGQRNFKQAYWLHTVPSVNDQFVGGFAFEYSMEMENAKSESPFPFNKFGHANYGIEAAIFEWIGYNMIGYFRPENCDDIHIPCAFHPLPNFDSLRQQYVSLRDNNATISSVSLANFDVPDYRKGRSVCPSEFPALSEFVWVADHVPDLACPHREPASNFVCPANLNNLRPLSRVHQLAMVVAAFLLLFIMGTPLYFMFRACREDSAGKKQSDDDSDNVPWPKIVFVPKLRRGDGDTASSESMGLLSLTNMPHQGEYHAIESDASSDSNN